jgi:hypothetical protein
MNQSARATSAATATKPATLRTISDPPLAIIGPVELGPLGRGAIVELPGITAIVGRFAVVGIDGLVGLAVTFAVVGIVRLVGLAVTFSFAGMIGLVGLARTLGVVVVVVVFRNPLQKPTTQVLNAHCEFEEHEA